MAADWMKVEHTTPDKPEVLAIASTLGISPDEAFGKCFRMWRWFDQQTIEGVAPGISILLIDHIVGLRGFADAILRVGWLEVSEIEGEPALVMPEFTKSNGKSAKERALTAKRVAKHSGKTNGDSVSLALAEPLPRKEKGEREVERDSNRDRTDRQKPSGQSLLENSDSGGGEELQPLDLSHIDWESVTQMAGVLAKRVPPVSAQDRRQWFKFCVMAHSCFSEHWLMDSAEAVLSVKNHAKNAQGHLVAVLKKKAAEEGVDASTFLGILRRIEIPADVWKSDVMKVRK